MHLPTGLKLARNAISGWVTGRPRITQCNLHLSFRCNLFCRYCNYPRLAGEELGTAQWLDIIDQLAGLGCCRVDLTGGEVLLRPDLTDIIGRIRERGMACVIASNGILVPSKIRDIARANTLILSLDSLGPSNDRIRGTGAGKAAVEAVRTARSIGLAVKLNAVLTADMLLGLDDLIDFSERLRLPLTVNLVRSGNPELWNKAAELRPDPAETRRALLRLAEMSRRNSWLLFSPRTYLQAVHWPDYAVDYIDRDNIRTFPRWRHGPRCQAGRFFLNILPDGRAVPCSLRIKAGPFGNAATKGVAAAWKAVQAHACLDCYSPCKLEQNYLYSGKMSVLFNFATKHLPRVT